MRELTQACKSKIKIYEKLIKDGELIFKKDLPVYCDELRQDALKRANELQLIKNAAETWVKKATAGLERATDEITRVNTEANEVKIENHKLRKKIRKLSHSDTNTLPHAQDNKMCESNETALQKLKFMKVSKQDNVNIWPESSNKGFHMNARTSNYIAREYKSTMNRKHKEKGNSENSVVKSAYGVTSRTDANTKKVQPSEIKVTSPGRENNIGNSAKKSNIARLLMWRYYKIVNVGVQSYKELKMHMLSYLSMTNFKIVSIYTVYGSHTPYINAMFRIPYSEELTTPSINIVGNMSRIFAIDANYQYRKHQYRPSNYLKGESSYNYYCNNCKGALERISREKSSPSLHSSPSSHSSTTMTSVFHKSISSI